MTIKDWICKKNGDIITPKTYTECVYDSNNNRLDDIIQRMGDSIGIDHIDITGQTIDLNNLNLNNGTDSREKLTYICKTDDGAGSIQNNVFGTVSFILEVELVAYKSTTDYKIKQIYYSDDGQVLTRYCTNGTWGTWTPIHFSEFPTVDNAILTNIGLNGLVKSSGTTIKNLTDSIATKLSLTGGTLTDQLNCRAIVPTAGSTYDLGASNIHFKYGHFDTVYSGSIHASYNHLVFKSVSGYAAYMLVDTGLLVQGTNQDSWKPVQASAFTVSSSRLVKENIKDMTNEEANKIMELRPVSFDYKENFGEKDQYNFIAEEVLELYPNVVTVPENYSESDFDESKGIANKTLALDDSKLIPFIVKKMQIMQEEIDELKKSNTELRGLVNTLVNNK